MCLHCAVSSRGIAGMLVYMPIMSLCHHLVALICLFACLLCPSFTSRQSGQDCLNDFPCPCVPIHCSGHACSHVCMSCSSTNTWWPGLACSHIHCVPLLTHANLVTPVSTTTITQSGQSCLFPMPAISQGITQWPEHASVHTYHVPATMW